MAGYTAIQILCYAAYDVKIYLNLAGGFQRVSIFLFHVLAFYYASVCVLYFISGSIKFALNGEAKSNAKVLEQFSWARSGEPWLKIISSSAYVANFIL